MKNSDELERFLGEAARAAGNATLGILLDVETAMAGDEDGTLKRLAARCDFLALDLRGLSKYADHSEVDGEPDELYLALDALKYYVKVYSMRIVLSKNNERLKDSAAQYGASSIQVIE